MFGTLASPVVNLVSRVLGRSQTAFEMTLDTVLDRMVSDRIPCNELAAEYELSGIRRVELRDPRTGAEVPSLWVNGRYVGEFNGDQEAARWIANCVRLGDRDESLKVNGYFQHLAFIIEKVEFSEP